MKERKKMQKKRAINDLNAPTGSRDIPFHDQLHLHLYMTSQTQCCKTMEE